LLSSSLRPLIAAEVVYRPSSVVKNLFALGDGCVPLQ